MRRINKYVVLLGTFLIISIIGIGIVHSQYKVRTLQNILPGSWQYHADRYYETYVSPAAADADSLETIFAPFQYKTRVHSMFFLQIGKEASATNDSFIVRLSAGRTRTCGENFLNDTTIYVLDSLYTELGTSKSTTHDTIGAGEKIGIKLYNGGIDSTGISTTFEKFAVRLELEIIE